MGKGCKVVVCGQAAVGKTAIVEQLLYGNHSVGKKSCSWALLQNKPVDVLLHHVAFVHNRLRLSRF